MNNEAPTTREKILMTAHELFALKGLQGASMRDIAQKAEVPLSAINYHFKSKNLLYAEVFKHSFQWLESEIAQLATEAFAQTPPAFNSYTKILANGLNEFFQNNALAFMNSFKIVLLDRKEFGGELKFPSISEQTLYGPPGGKYLLSAIMKDLNLEIPPTTKHLWAMRCLFAHIVHFSLMSLTPFVQDQGDKFKYMTDSNTRRLETFQLIDALFLYLTHN